MILLVIYGYMEDEVYRYKNLDALFEHWKVKNLKELNRWLRTEDFSIYEVSKTIHIHKAY